VELRQLEYALAVADELHFGRAAARMHVTQQSVSEQIRRLERELGAPLFTRTSRRVTVTTAGQAFLPEARRAVAAARHALEVGRRAARGETSRLRIGYAEDLTPRLIQLITPRLAAHAPPVRVTPVPMTTPDQLTALVEHRLDLAFGWTPDLVPELAALRITREPLVLALAENHPLAAETAVEPARLSGRPLALVPRDVNPSLHDRMVGQLAARGTTVEIRQEVSSLDRLLPLVLADAAIGVTIASAAASKPFTGIVYRRFTDPTPYADCHLIWRRDTTNPAIAAFIDTARELRDNGTFRPEYPNDNTEPTS
jgi:DNA-binding transcriptional LysR family regulator